MVIAHLSFIALDISIGDDLDNSRSHGLEFDSISNDCDLFVLLSDFSRGRHLNIVFC
jgi:hypothetical protein